MQPPLSPLPKCKIRFSRYIFTQKQNIHLSVNEHTKIHRSFANGKKKDESKPKIGIQFKYKLKEKQMKTVFPK